MIFRQFQPDLIVLRLDFLDAAFNSSSLFNNSLISKLISEFELFVPGGNVCRSIDTFNAISA